MNPDIRALELRLEALSTDSEKVDAIMAYIDAEQDYERPSIDLEASTTNAVPSSVDQIDTVIIPSLIHKHHLQDHFMERASQLRVRQVQDSLPPDRLRCANHHSQKPRDQCPKLASKVCSGCRLVSYCSKECQKSHWATHKKDCKNRLGRSDWKPAWVFEARTPAFVDPNVPGFSQQRYGHYRLLWGNVPARDILNLHRNEGASNITSKPMALAFIASGDLRNVIRTVNELPEDYQGQLSIVINDLDPFVVCRNFIILFVLALLPENLAPSELALHIWYSVFVPDLAFSHIKILLMKQVTLGEHNEDITVPCGNSILFAPGILRMLIGDHMEETSKLSPAQANNELNAIMMAPERVDYRDRYYAGLKPSHRVAFEKWRQFGLVHPFGAFNANINVPNPWLFLSDGQLSLNDSASPLSGWDLQEVLKTGPAHGTTQDDLLGCLYFYVKDQLNEFARRLHRFNARISMTLSDAIELATSVQSGSVHGLTARSFDRIEVSNIVDREYIGVQTVLSTWGPLLNKANKHSAIIGLYMNWMMYVQGGKCEDQDAVEKAVGIMKKKYSKFAFAHIWGPSSDDSTTNLVLMQALKICHENSSAFERFLRIEKADEAAKKAGLQVRKLNTIVPHRFGCSLGSSWRTLPTILGSEELQYIWASIQRFFLRWGFQDLLISNGM